MVTRPENEVKNMLFDYLDLETLKKEPIHQKPVIKEIMTESAGGTLEEKLRSKGFLIYAMGECYGKQITINTEILIQRVNDGLPIWTGYRRSYDRHHNFKSEKIILESENLLKVLKAAEDYIKNYLDFIKRRP